jgi:hypothetical protein
MKFTGSLLYSDTVTNINEELYLLGYKAMWSTKSQPKFQRKIWPPSSGSKNKPNKRAA